MYIIWKQKALSFQLCKPLVHLGSIQTHFVHSISNSTVNNYFNIDKTNSLVFVILFDDESSFFDIAYYTMLNNCIFVSKYPLQIKVN